MLIIVYFWQFFKTMCHTCLPSVEGLRLRNGHRSKRYVVAPALCDVIACIVAMEIGGIKQRGREKGGEGEGGHVCVCVCV